MMYKFKEMFILAYKDYKNVLLRVAFILSIAVQGKIYIMLNNYRGKVYHIPTSIDAWIPFNKYFIVPYIYWYLYIAVILFYYAVYDERKYFRILAGINIGMMVCFVIYYFFPTYVPRPEVYGNDIFENLVKYIYANDNPYNCFPSIHVFESVLLAIYINRDLEISTKTKLTSTILAVSIVLSTMFVKQHYFYDVLAGTLLGYSIYAVFNFKEIADTFKRKVLVYIKIE